MILAYPYPWTGTAPVYLVCDDKAFYLIDDVTVHNFQRTGIPAIGMTEADMGWVLEKLDPNVEHPLSSGLLRDPQDPFAA